MASCSSLLPVAVLKHHDQKQCEQKKVYFIIFLDNSPSLRKVRQKSGGRNGGRGHGGMLLPGLLPCFAQHNFYTTQDQMPRHGTTHILLGPPSSIINLKKNALHTCPQANLMGATPRFEGASSQATLVMLCLQKLNNREPLQLTSPRIYIPAPARS